MIFVHCCAGDNADYVLLCVDALTGVTRITREHLAVAVALEVPTALVITKADAADSRQLQTVLQQLQQLMAPVLSAQRSCRTQCVQHRQQGPEEEGHGEQEQQVFSDAAGAAKAAAGDAAAGQACVGPASGVPVVLTECQASSLAAALSELHSCTAAAASFQQVTYPVFTVSCVTGAGLSLLHAFLSRLKPVSADRSNRQCGTGSTTLGVVPDGGSNSSSSSQGLAAEALLLPGHQPQDSGEWQRQQPQQQQPHQQLLGMDGSSSLWVPEVPVGDAAAAAASAAGVDPSATDEPHAASAAARGSAAAGGRSGGSCFSKPAAAAAAGSASQPAGHFQVVHTYDVEGVGWVVSGIAVSGVCTAT